MGIEQKAHRSSFSSAQRHHASSRRQLSCRRVPWSGCSIQAKLREESGLRVKKVLYGDTVLVEQDDAAGLAIDEELSLMNWGNAYVRGIIKDGT